MVGWSEQESWGMDDKLKGEFRNSLKNTWLTSPLVTPPVSLTHTHTHHSNNNKNERAPAVRCGPGIESAGEAN